MIPSRLPAPLGGRLPLCAEPAVGALWLAGVVGALAFIAVFSSPLPFSDTWELGRDLVTWPSLERLWSQHNEHRIPLPRLALVALARTAGDLRAGMYAQVALLGAVSALMMLAARRLRGRASLSDAFFPLLWLHWGNAENLLMSWQLSLTLPIALGVGVWLPVLLGHGLPGARAMTVSGLCLVALPLCGGHGLTQVPALALWMLAAGAWLRRAGAPPAGARIARGAAVLALLVLVLYFHGLHTPEHLPRSRDPVRVGRVALQLLTLSFGPAVRAHWTAWALPAAAAAAVPAWLLWRRGRGDTVRALRMSALAAGALGIVTMALSAGIGRAEHEPDAGLTGRYVQLSAPLLCCAWFSLLLAGGRLASAGPAALAILAALALPANLRWGTSFGGWLRPALAEVEQDIAAGAGIEAIAQRHGRLLYGHDGLDEHLSMFARAGLLPKLSDGDPCAWLPTRPACWAADRPLFSGELDGRRIVVAPVRSELHYELGPGRHVLEFAFGVRERVLQPDPDACTAVVFRVETFESGAGEPRSIFERTLDPRDLEQGAEIFQARIECELERSARMTFRTRCGNPPASPALQQTCRKRGVFPFWSGILVRRMDADRVPGG